MLATYTKLRDLAVDEAWQLRTAEEEEKDEERVKLLAVGERVIRA